jgi:hypothetical protein
LETYRNYIIRKTDPVPPIPGWEQFKFSFTHKDYDGDCDPRHGHGPTVMDCKRQINEAIEDDGDQ